MSRFIDNICPMVHTRCDRECGTCEECDKELKEMLADHDKQIRNEVIDEFSKRVKSLHYNCSNDGGATYYMAQKFCNRDIDEIAKQLKEKR